VTMRLVLDCSVWDCWGGRPASGHLPTYQVCLYLGLCLLSCCYIQIIRQSNDQAG
jgi:hypothetical protein